jgi:hypothetical protein
MCAPGSSWKLYIDPPQDVICYHNFSTNEKILEYAMTDEKLREINIANYYAEEVSHEVFVFDNNRVVFCIFFINVFDRN